MSDDVMISQKFVTRGTFVAFPLSFPGVSAEIEPESAFITALDVRRRGTAVAGGTSGASAHLFSARLKANAGYVFDHGPIDGMADTVAIRIRNNCMVAACNGPAGGRVVLQMICYAADGIQEWGFRRLEYLTLAEFPGERILDLVLPSSEPEAVVLTARRLVRLPLDERLREMSDTALAALADTPCAKRAKWTTPEHFAPVDIAAVANPRIGKLALLPNGRLYFSDAAGKLFHYDRLNDAARDTGISLVGTGTLRGWTVTPDGLAWYADETGQLHAVDSAAGVAKPMKKALLADVRVLAAAPDGRVFGLCGDGIGRFFEATQHSMRDLGAVATCLSVKRYGFDFACAATGADGEIYFGENDRGGHLWIYFPALT